MLKTTIVLLIYLFFIIYILLRLTGDAKFKFFLSVSFDLWLKLQCIDNESVFESKW